MPRYVLLRHDCPERYRIGSHWDLMLEQRDGLLTWSLAELPSAWGGNRPNDAVPADRLPDHRVAYLEYEGPVSGDRGEVRRVARGELEWIARSENTFEARLIDGELPACVRLAIVESDKWLLCVTPK